MKSARRKLIVIVLASALGVVALWVSAVAFVVTFLRPRDTLSQLYERDSHEIAQHLTPELYARLGCTVRGFTDLPAEVTLTPSNAAKSHEFLKRVIEYNQFRPCYALLKKHSIAPEGNLTFFATFGGEDRPLICIAVYEGGPNAVSITSVLAGSHTPIVTEMSQSDHEALRELIASVKTHNGTDTLGRSPSGATSATSKQ